MVSELLPDHFLDTFPVEFEVVNKEGNVIGADD